MLITISGEPGSGKTTVAKLLAADLDLPHVYAGDLYRQEARRRGLSLEAFNALCERDHSIDRNLDTEMIEIARRGRVILEGRLAGFFARQQNLHALKVWLTASEEVRARRVAERESADSRQQLEINRARHASDVKRYKEIYGADLSDRSIYDVVLSSDDRTPQQLADELAAAARRFFSAESVQP